MKSRAKPIVLVALTTCILVVVNLLLRDVAWQREATLGAFTVSFYSVMIVPLFAGVCCWWATSLCIAANTTLQLAARRYTVVLREVSILFTPIAAIYIVIIASMWTYAALTSGTTPHWLLAIQLLDSLFLIFTCGTIGFVVGAKFHWTWTPIFAAAILFAAILGAYNSPLAPVVQTGGATASLVGLLPNWKFHALGALGQLALMSLSLTHFLTDESAQNKISRAASWAFLLGAAFTVTAVHTSHNQEELDFRLVATTADTVCENTTSGTLLCLGAGYHDLFAPTTQAINLVSEKLRAMGERVPTAWDQARLRGEPISFSKLSIAEAQRSNVTQLQEELAWQYLTPKISDLCFIKDSGENITTVIDFLKTPSGEGPAASEAKQALAKLKKC